MIARHWRGLVKSDRAAEYEEHLRSETFPALERIQGFLGEVAEPTDHLLFDMALFNGARPDPCEPLQLEQFLREDRFQLFGVNQQFGVLRTLRRRHRLAHGFENDTRLVFAQGGDQFGRNIFVEQVSNAAHDGFAEVDSRSARMASNRLTTSGFSCFRYSW